MSSSAMNRLTAAWHRLDHWLLLHHPRLWTMRFHTALALGLAAAGLAVGIASLVVVRVDDVPNVRPFFLSLAALSSAASLWWTILQFRVRRHISVRGYEGGGWTFLLNLLCLSAINLAPLAATSFLQQRIAEVAPREQVAADDEVFHAGMEALASYDADRSTFRCDDFRRDRPGTFCAESSPPPAALLASECTQWAVQISSWMRIDCDKCVGAPVAATNIRAVIERYGCERTGINLAHLRIAHSLGAEETAPSRRHFFLVWFLSILMSITLTLVRTTSTRLLVEAAVAIGCTWIVLTFLSTAYDVPKGASQLLTLGVCMLGLPTGLLCGWARPTRALLRLLIASCLLAPAATLLVLVSIITNGESLAGTDVVQLLSEFASQWSRLVGDDFVDALGGGRLAVFNGTIFAAELGFATLITFVLMMVYRPAAQRLAALPPRR